MWVIWAFVFLVFKSVYSNDGDCVSEWNVAMYCGTLESSNWEDSGGLTATNGIKFMPRPRECFHTDPGVDGNRRPWWSVYLGQVYKILYVKITSRTDCCGQWLKNPNNFVFFYAWQVGTFAVCPMWCSEKFQIKIWKNFSFSVMTDKQSNDKHLMCC